MAIEHSLSAQSDPAVPLLHVQDLQVTVGAQRGGLVVVDGAALTVRSGETVGLVGESGCGKTVTALATLGLTSRRGGRVTSGHIWFSGQDLLTLPAEQLRKLRGRHIAMVFQEPMDCFNPVYTIGSQLEEALQVHLDLTSAQRRERVIELFRLVGIPLPAERVTALPRQLSGGMLQRAMIAMALSAGPRLLIADEPTTSLDVTIQAQVLWLMRSLQQRFGMAILLISHNLGVIAQVAERVVVMYAGQTVESAPVRELFQQPAHPYTIGLLESLPRPDEDRPELRVIPGDVPVPGQWPTGCRFHPRCPLADHRCSTSIPPLASLTPEREVRCWYPQHDRRRERKRQG